MQTSVKSSDDDNTGNNINTKSSAHTMHARPNQIVVGKIVRFVVIFGIGGVLCMDNTEWKFGFLILFRLRRQRRIIGELVIFAVVHYAHNYNNNSTNNSDDLTAVLNGHPSCAYMGNTENEMNVKMCTLSHMMSSITADGQKNFKICIVDSIFPDERHI